MGKNHWHHPEKEGWSGRQCEESWKARRNQNRPAGNWGHGGAPGPAGDASQSGERGRSWPLSAHLLMAKYMKAQRQENAWHRTTRGTWVSKDECSLNMGSVRDLPQRTQRALETQT